MSCGQIALDKLGFGVNNYFASEINQYSIKVTQKNYPNTKQIGDIRDITESDIKNMGDINLLMGGSPCQNLSPAVINREHYNQGLEGEKSSLFYEYVRVLDLVNKHNDNFYFLLENVGGMSSKDKEIITKTLDVEPIMIDSALISAQDRKRYYWTNIDVKNQLKDKGQVLKDIMQSKKQVDSLHNNSRMNFWYDEEFEFHGLDKKVAATLKITGHDILKRVYSPNYKCGTLTACRGGNTQKKVLQAGKCRKLTPIEYERLQTVPEGYTGCVSNTRRYNMLGDGWTVDVIKHILSFI